MGFRNTWSRVGSIPFTENGVQTLDLQRGFLIRSVGMRLQGTVTVAGAAATAANPEAPFTLVRRIEVIGDGRDTLFNMSGEQLRSWLAMYYGGVPAFSPPNLAGVVGAVGVNTFAAYMPIPFESPLTRVPIDTLLDSRRYENLQLRITWGQVTSGANVNSDLLEAAAATTQAPGTITIDVAQFQTSEPSGQLFSQMRRYAIEKDITAANTDFDTDINTGQTIRSLLVRSTFGTRLGTGVPITPSNAIVQDLSVIADNAHFPANRVVGNIIRDQNASDYRVIDPNFTTVAGAVSGFAGVKIPDGLYLLDFVEDGMLSTAINSADIASLKLRANVALSGSGGDRLSTIVTEIIPAPVAEVVTASMGR
jgi:hypothetical protein